MKKLLLFLLISLGLIACSEKESELYSISSGKFYTLNWLFCSVETDLNGDTQVLNRNSMRAV